MKKGDVVTFEPNVEHWHGASINNEMTHIAINPNTEKGLVEWLKKVTDNEFQDITQNKILSFFEAIKLNDSNKLKLNTIDNVEF